MQGAATLRGLRRFLFSSSRAGNFHLYVRRVPGRTALPPPPPCPVHPPTPSPRHAPYTGICSQNGCLTNSELIRRGDFDVQTRSQARCPNHRRTNSHAEAGANRTTAPTPLASTPPGPPRRVPSCERSSVGGDYSRTRSVRSCRCVLAGRGQDSTLRTPRD
jgi:hypothetical protein